MNCTKKSCRIWQQSRDQQEKILNQKKEIRRLLNVLDQLKAGTRTVQVVHKEYAFGCEGFGTKDGKFHCYRNYDEDLCSVNCPGNTAVPGAYKVNGKRKKVTHQRSLEEVIKEAKNGR